ncbi:EVE domain-containing protein [Rickettsiales endosymbiont of Trichoplax sp. H2]|uniref:EVE domain-containing protein n=1 Tax=Rickettsiales endosymbiont of Trichoplax sp. H2 TaxID=2021221 RepID=UPI0012B38490|nr:EVE domain-containing protein [Rickettsiales endosymbiont of Trichoplax sp. H2]MSO13273.1 Thymocyte nuclear protein 1 [Rickettsiales endosymbiont of Trichoplax sp. H2]
MKYWLIKSEPNSYSWTKMQQDKVTCWDGVRNYQARNNMRKMKLGDLAFFYHSNQEKAIKGLVKVVKEYYPDHTDPSGKFDMVDFKYISSFKNSVSLAEIKQNPNLQDIALVKQSRLSVMPITAKEYNIITAIAN